MGIFAWIESMGAFMSIPGIIVLYGASSFACKWLCGKHIHQLFFSAVDADKQFVDFIIEESAVIFAVDSGQDRAAVKTKIRELFEGKTEPPELASLLRIDYDIEKTSPTLAHLWIHLLIRKGETAKKLTVEHDIEWAWLPNLVREKFIRENPTRQAYVFVSREDSGRAGETLPPNFSGSLGE